MRQNFDALFESMQVIKKTREQYVLPEWVVKLREHFEALAPPIYDQTAFKNQYVNTCDEINISPKIIIRLIIV